MDPARTDDEHFRRVELVLASGVAVALKGYLGYVHYGPEHANYRRYYELAAKYRVPVLFHTGDTYSPQAKLKYAHPLGVDEVAVDHPDCRFVLCHLGNPWVTDAAEVIYKNMNVWADLSGLVVGDDGAFASEEGREAKAELAHAIRRAIAYSERPNRFLYGSDWPLAPMAAYREFVKEALPVEWHELVFEENARRLFRLG
jgi:predicted TIM-barrel fold metal-dependent hydrolase